MAPFPTRFQPLPTEWNGYQFRSRIEARWAVFFDALNIPYRYEIEGFDMGGVHYQPDFWLPDQDCWFEVKGEPPHEDERDKALRLAIGSKHDAFIAWGDCILSIGGYSGIEAWLPEGIHNGPMLWADTPRGFRLTLAGYDDLNGDIRRTRFAGRTPRLVRAYRLARQERFGH